MKLVKDTGPMRHVLGRLKDTVEQVPSSSLRFYASGLPLCPRAFWLGRVLGVPPRRMSYQDEVAMDVGTVIHTSLQRWLGRSGMLYGNWKCPLCGATLYDRQGPPLTCALHTRTELVYDEYKFYHEELACKPDALLRAHARGAFTVAEFKSVGSWGFRSLKEPYPNHIEQVNAYANVLQLRGFDVSACWVWYVDAGYAKGRPKIWEFKPRRHQFLRHLVTMQHIRHLLKTATTTAPSRTCTAAGDSPWCAFLTECWADNFNSLVREAQHHDDNRHHRP